MGLPLAAKYLGIILTLLSGVHGGRYSDPDEWDGLVIPLAVVAVILVLMLVLVLVFTLTGRCQCACCVKATAQSSSRQHHRKQVFTTSHPGSSSPTTSDSYHCKERTRKYSAGVKVPLQYVNESFVGDTPESEHGVFSVSPDSKIRNSAVRNLTSRTSAEITTDQAGCTAPMLPHAGAATARIPVGTSDVKCSRCTHCEQSDRMLDDDSAATTININHNI